MFENRKAIIWDLDNTLYAFRPEFGDLLDTVMAEILINQLGVKMDLGTAKNKVKESYALYRDGGELFCREYGVDPKAFYDTYHNNMPYDQIIPYDGLAEKLEQLPFEHFVFTYSSKSLAEKIIKKLGLWEIFEGNIYSVEDFGLSKKNENAGVYIELCKRIGYNPTDCIFVDDSYSNLEFPKEIGMTTVRIFYNQNSAKDKPYIDAAYRGIIEFIGSLLPMVKRSIS